MVKSGYHHGLIIREYRLKAGMSQSALAAKWHSNEIGVHTSYVQRIEKGTKEITDLTTLHRVAEILKIPVARFGLSSCNPFAVTPDTIGERAMKDFGVDITEVLLENAWHMHRTTSLEITEKVLAALIDKTNDMRENMPTAITNSKRFKRLIAATMELKGAVQIDRRQYSTALATARDVLEIGEDMNDPVFMALAYKDIAWELNRAGNRQDAIEAGEKAREYTFRTSKALASLISSYASRIYAENREKALFEKTADTALNLAHHLGNSYMCLEDYTYQAQSDILGGICSSMLDLGLVSEALMTYEQFEKQVLVESNQFEYVLLSLVLSRAHFLKKDLEQSTYNLREFFLRCSRFQSPHLINRGIKVIGEMKKDYPVEKLILNLEQEIIEQVNKNQMLKPALNE